MAEEDLPACVRDMKKLRNVPEVEIQAPGQDEEMMGLVRIPEDDMYSQPDEAKPTPGMHEEPPLVVGFSGFRQGNLKIIRRRQIAQHLQPIKDIQKSLRKKSGIHYFFDGPETSQEIKAVYVQDLVWEQCKPGRNLEFQRMIAFSEYHALNQHERRSGP